jgi:multidrug resistance efflux pump
MRTRRLVAVLLLSASCVIGAVWEYRRRAAPKSHPGGNVVRLSGMLTPVEAIAIPVPLLELSVPPNTYVRRGQAIGVAALEEGGDATLEMEARWRLAEADTAAEAARRRLNASETELAAARANESADQLRLIAATEEAIEGEHQAQRGALLYRQGMENALAHDQDLARRRAAAERRETLARQAAQAAPEIDSIEAKRAEARHDLQGALERRRLALEAAGNAARTVQTTAPADGYLIVRNEYAGIFAIAPRLERDVEASVTAAQLALLPPGRVAAVTLEGQPGTVLHAKVMRVGAAQNGAGEAVFPVTLAVLEPTSIRTDDPRVTLELGSAR